MSENGVASDGPDAGATSRRAIAQWVGAFAVVSGVILVFAASFGWVEYNEPGTRIIVIGGVALLLGWRAKSVIG